MDVTYIPTHTNHEPGVAESKYLPLPSSIKDSISVKLQDGIPVERIMDGRITFHDATIIPIQSAVLFYLSLLIFSVIDIREDIASRKRRASFTDSIQRKHFLTRKDLLNLKRKVCHLTSVRHQEDSISVDYLVHELQQEEYNPVLLYKPQHKTEPSLPQFPASSFILVIQTKFQMELFKAFSESVVCIDSTHNTNAYRFKLTTLLVPDEFGEGW